MQADKPAAAELYIGAGGTLAWNGTAAFSKQLDEYLAAAAGQRPQPEIHRHRDPQVRYADVARVLACCQWHGLFRMAWWTPASDGAEPSVASRTIGRSCAVIRPRSAMAMGGGLTGQAAVPC